MKQVKRWRYYCEFCKKAGGVARHIEKHEKRCTANPNRECGVCPLMEESQTPMADLQAALIVGYKELREAANNCPACILAALRQAPDGNFNLESQQDGRFDFDFKSEMKSIYDDALTSRRDEQMSSAYYGESW